MHPLSAGAEFGAWDMYTNSMYSKSKDHENDDPTVLYRRIFARSRTVTVELIGVWVSELSEGISMV